MKLLLLFKNKRQDVHECRCHYSRLEAPSCDMNLLLHCTGLNRNGGTFSSMIPMPENAHLSGCMFSNFSLRKHFNLQTEPVMVLTKLWAVPKEHSICSVSRWTRAPCFASALSKNIIYPHHFLLHSCHAGKANLLQCLGQRCMVGTTTILCFL